MSELLDIHRDIGRMEADVLTMKNDIREVREDVRNMKDDIQEIKKVILKTETAYKVTTRLILAIGIAIGALASFFLKVATVILPR